MPARATPLERLVRLIPKRENELDIFTDNHASNVSAQTDQLRLVFVCSAGMLRSATGAKAFAARGCNTRSCGTNGFALIPLSANLIAWADRIYFAHQGNW